MDKNKKFLSDVIVYSKYSKYISELNRRESWDELVDRNMNMHLERFPELEKDIKSAYELVRQRKVLPSMRTMQFAGKPIKVNQTRGYNCSFLAIDDYRSFNEIMHLLLSGCGVGYSVQRHHVEKLPEIKKPNGRKQRYVIGDSIEGWADSIKMLMKSYLGYSNKKIEFDFSDIRPKGALLVTSGGKAPGPQPLKECLIKIKGILDNKNNGEKLKPIECHSLICHIADAVLSGGIRRAACISLFSIDDMDMMTCKSGSWWETNPHFGRANNSVVLLRNTVSKEQFFSIWNRVKVSGAGEPGIFWTNDLDIGCNPCAEIGLKSKQFCNLTEVNVSEIGSHDDLMKRIWAATLIGTLQATFTDFHYLREDWEINSEKDALLGVSLTGIASNEIFNYNIANLAEYAKEVNKWYSSRLGINPAARVTTVKPSGTASIVLGTASGIHAWHDKFYKRRIRVGKNEALYTYLQIYHNELIEDDYFRPHDTAVLTVPIKAPENSVIRNESALDMLKRISRIYNEWVINGHNEGINHNNVSATVSVKDDEWDVVGSWMWENKENYSGLSVLPYDGGTYIQAPFESISEEEYWELSKHIKDFDVTKIVELFDSTDRQGELACSGGNCEII